MFSARMDPLPTLFNNHFEEVGLVDVEPTSLMQTWCNDRDGD